MKLPVPPTQGPSRGCALHQRQLVDRSALRILARPLGESASPGDVRDDLGQVADAALGVDDSGLFAAGRAIADELHGRDALFAQEEWVVERHRKRIMRRHLRQGKAGEQMPVIL